MVKIKQFVCNSFGVNTYVLYDETGECVIIDAGCYQPKEEMRLKNFIDTQSLSPKLLIQTHGHIDHILGAGFVCKTWQIPFCVHSADTYLVTNALQLGRMFGFEAAPVPGIDMDLASQSSLHFGNTEINLISTPGHTPGGISLHLSSEKLLFSGDVLFAGSIGRTDLPGGDYDQLMESIQNKLLILDLETRVYPGHGYITTLGEELAENPFLFRPGSSEKTF